jgi:hypothetical protein
VPDPPEVPLRRGQRPPTPDRRSRRERIEADGGEPQLPFLEAPHLIEYLFEAGPVLSGMGGPVVLTWCEIEAWQRRVGLELQPWESRLMRHLSGVYANELVAARDPMRSPPFSSEPTEDHRARVARKIDNLFRGRALGEALRRKAGKP